MHDINRQEMQDQQLVVCWHDDFVKMCWHLEKSCECVVNSSAWKKIFVRPLQQKMHHKKPTFHSIVQRVPAHTLSLPHIWSLSLFLAPLLSVWKLKCSYSVNYSYIKIIQYMESTKWSPTLPTSDLDSEVFFFFQIFISIWISNHEPNQQTCFKIKHKLI